jgi:hypothetical protein
MARREKHLYRYGAKSAEEREFETRYGKTKGKRVYGAVVGEVERQRATDVEDDRPGSRSGEHEVEQHTETVRGREYRVRGHRAANPRK